MRLLELRKSKKISQAELSKILNIPQTTYSSYETNRTMPDINTLLKLAKYYNTTIEFILGENTEIVNLLTLSNVKSDIIKNVLEVDEIQAQRIKSYIDGIIGK